MVDLRPLLVEIEKMLPLASKTHRPALLALHCLYNFCVPDGYRSDGYAAFRDAHFPEFSQPTIEALVTATAIGWTWSNSLADHRAMIDQYFAERIRPTGLHAPRLPPRPLDHRNAALEPIPTVRHRRLPLKLRARLASRSVLGNRRNQWGGDGAYRSGQCKLHSVAILSKKTSLWSTGLSHGAGFGFRNSPP